MTNASSVVTCDELIALFEQANSTYQTSRLARSKVVRQVLESLASLEKDEQVRVMTHIAETLPVSQMTEPFVKQASARGVPLKTAASFRQQLAIATRRRQLSGFRPELALNDKGAGYKFIDKLGIRRPEVYATKQRFKKLELRDMSVLKPVNGSSSNGIYIIIDSKTIKEVKTGEMLDSIEALEARVGSLIDSKKVRDRWFLEELVADVDDGEIIPASDLKFYCFYGKLGFVLEVERSDGGRYCEWLPSGELADTGRYETKSFEGDGFTQEQVATALEISKQIAAPFMRIDFLRSSTDFSFCEFTPRPGQFNSFNQEFDRYLGELYLEAEARLLGDLLEGKKFSAFNKNN